MSKTHIEDLKPGDIFMCDKELYYKDGDDNDDKTICKLVNGDGKPSGSGYDVFLTDHDLAEVIINAKEIWRLYNDSKDTT